MEHHLTKKEVFVAIWLWFFVRLERAPKIRPGKG